MFAGKLSTESSFRAQRGGTPAFGEGIGLDRDQCAHLSFRTEEKKTESPQEGPPRGGWGKRGARAGRNGVF